MSNPRAIDGVLVEWGDRLFYPGNRIVHVKSDPRLRRRDVADRAAAIRARIEATVVRRAPQVMVKVTGGGRGMKAIAAHFRYISKQGRLEIEDERGQVVRGKESLRELVEEWRYGGGLIDDASNRREAFNIMLSMPRGSADALTIQRAAREFARAELEGHKYVMVLHDHQANPHVHLSVRAESRFGRRLNPRKADLQRWREAFAEKLRGWGIEAEATRQATRGVSRRYPSLWQVKAAQDQRLVKRVFTRLGASAAATRASALTAWTHIRQALAATGDARDATLVASIDGFVGEPHVRSEPQRLDRTPTVRNARSVERTR
jgi:hypothetical protein